MSQRWKQTAVKVGKTTLDVPVDRKLGGGWRASIPFAAARKAGVELGTIVEVRGKRYRVADVNNIGERDEILACVLLPVAGKKRDADE